MTELGPRLKEAREEKGLTLEDLFERTKIQVKFLKALEEEEFHVFPGQVYIKGALRNYAEAVGLDYSEVSSLYHGDGGASPAPEKKRDEKRINILPPPKKPLNIRPFFVLLIVFLIVAALIYIIGVFLDQENLGLPPEDDPQVVEPVLDDEEEPREEPEPDPPAPIVSLIQPDPEREEYILTGTPEIQLELSFNGDCWIRVREEGTEGVSGTYRRGQSFSYVSEVNLRVRLGAPRAVESFTINGMELEVKVQSTPYNIDILLEDDEQR